jgi:hypothetical protein
MMRPYVLTRLRNEEGAWEYTRYLAEANAILRVNEPVWFKILPLPDKSEYASAEEPPPAPTLRPEVKQPGLLAEPPLTRDQAIQALREKQYLPAIGFFKKELADRPNYHSGWSRLGYAQREYAAYLMDGEKNTEAEVQLGDSIRSYGNRFGD